MKTKGESRRDFIKKSALIGGIGLTGGQSLLADIQKQGTDQIEEKNQTYIPEEGAVTEFFDAFLCIGRSNDGGDSPITEAEAISIMDKYDVTGAFVYHSLSRDTDVEIGNIQISKIISDKRLHKVWGIETAIIVEETPEEFVERAIKNDIKAFLLNPNIGSLKMTRSVRLKQIAAILEKRKIPLLIEFGPSADANCVEWYEMADFCNLFPKLSVIVREFRTYNNRHFFDALSLANNLMISVNSLWQNKMIPQTINSFGSHRIVFSMGIPGIFPGSMQMPILYSGLEMEKIKLISNGNIINLLKEANYE